MNKKRTKAFSYLLAFGMVLGIATAASAEPGWQVLGTDKVKFTETNFTQNWKTGKIVYEKDGGNIGISIPDHGYGKYGRMPENHPVMEIQVWEYDARTKDEWVGNVYYDARNQGAMTYSFNIEKFRDGINRKAEIYFKYTTNYTGSFEAKILD